MSQEGYLAAKAASAHAPAAEKPAMAAPAVPPTIVVKNYAGVNQTTAGGWRPPDSEGAVGASEYVQIVNSYIQVYSKYTNAVVRSQTLAQFFGYTTQTLFDPRVVYDSVWKRWIVTADAFAESSTVQRMFLAVSQTPKATGAFWIYNFNTVVNANDFFDYPMVGYDQDAIFITANNFNPGFTDARMFFFAKARLYNGLSTGVVYFPGLAGTLAAPIVQDQNVYTWFAAPQVNATPANSKIRLYRFVNLSRGGFASGAWLDLPVTGGFAFPPNAPQTGGQPLDTLDCRFQNVSTQIYVGGRYCLFNVHCVKYGGWPANKWYEINVTDPNAPAIRQSGTFWATGSSYDFSPHIATNLYGNSFVVWSVTDPANANPARRNAMVFFGGRKFADTLGSMGVNATPLFASVPYYDDNLGVSFNRWGDYSAVTIDPGNPNQAWMTNETILGTTSPSLNWGTQIGSVKY
jgi:hypothetical protein